MNYDGSVPIIGRVSRWQCNRFAAKYGVMTAEQAINKAALVEEWDVQQAQELMQYAVLLEQGFKPEPVVTRLEDLL